MIGHFQKNGTAPGQRSRKEGQPNVESPGEPLFVGMVRERHAPRAPFGRTKRSRSRSRSRLTVTPFLKRLSERERERWGSRKSAFVVRVAGRSANRCGATCVAGANDSSATPAPDPIVRVAVLENANGSLVDLRSQQHSPQRLALKTAPAIAIAPTSTYADSLLKGRQHTGGTIGGCAAPRESRNPRVACRVAGWGEGGDLDRCVLSLDPERAAAGEGLRPGVLQRPRAAVLRSAQAE